ncbi:LysR family transcriptional regulator [Gordonia sp. DT30]|uniref:LysR family transcriptional regulator n=1 Tax=Gordonia sp. DT30 TaxID=3416546 RepID=UPI003CF782C1
MIDAHRLRIFRAVVAEGSIGGAAAALGYTPSAVSQHIAGLQRETGLALVERSGRGIVPTDAGTTLAAESATVFDGLSRLDGLVADLRHGRAGTLRVAYFASAGAAWMPEIIAALGREFPDVRLDLRLIELAESDATPPDVEIYVESPETMGDRHGSLTPRPGFDAVPLVTEEYVVVVDEASPFAARSEVTLRELADGAWIDNDVARGPCREGLLRACTAAGFTPDFRVETHDYGTAMRFVAAGVGLTVVPALAVVELPAGVRAIAIAEPTPRRAIAVRRHHRAAHNPVADRVVELLYQQVRRTHGAAAL